MTATPKNPRRCLTVPIAIAALTWASAPALADVTKGQCVDANGKAQELRREGKLGEAREQLRLCSVPSCPAIVRDDCTKRLDDLERAQPTIAFEVKDATGADFSVVTVFVDGKPLATHLVGTALPVDVGEHVFTFEVSGQPRVSRTLVITEGEKGRRERIVIGTADARPSPPASSPTPEPKGADSAASTSATSATVEPTTKDGGMGPQRVLGLVAGGVGAAGIVAGGIFGLMAISQKNQQASDCGSGPGCKNYDQAVSDRSATLTDSTISTVGFIAGGALLVAGVTLVLTAGNHSERPSARGILVLPGVGPEGASISIHGEF
jgi:hypothetical protein